jgi:hypothetical protein
MCQFHKSLNLDFECDSRKHPFATFFVCFNLDFVASDSRLTGEAGNRLRVRSEKYSVVQVVELEGVLLS